MKLRIPLSKPLKSFGLDRASSELAREQFRMLTQQIPILYTVILINSWFMAFATAVFVDIWHALIFPAVATPIMIGRGLYWHRFGKRDALAIPSRQIRKAMRGTIIMANILAIVLGVWASELIFTVPTDYRPFIPLFTLLSMVSCAYCLSGLPLAAYSILISGSSMVVTAMVFTGDPILIAMSINILLVAILIVYMVSRQHAQLRRIVASRSKLSRQRSYANELAYQDQLTGLPNRRAMIKAMRELQQDEAENPVAMLMLDMNGFKPVNDTYGHAAGDMLLTEIGSRLSELADDNTIVARLGGDEFAVLMGDTESLDLLHDLAETMLREIEKPMILGDHELHVGAAVGIAMQPYMPDDPMELMRHADIALYEAKGKETRQISVFEGDMEARVKRRTMTEQALSDREEMREIILNYQPIFRMRDGAIIGYEALARWNHPELGQISPSEFVVAAERNGLATRLTVHLFEQAIEAANSWDENKHLSFNLSGSGLGTSDLEIILPNIIRDKDFDPARLHIEVTETALLSNMNAARRVLLKLRDLGVKIVLDDFGAGYASIGYLREMAFDGIKLDGSLIRDINRDEKSRQLLIGVLHLCRAIGTQVTAEMVENEEQLALLKPLPINNLQGYLLGAPVPANATLDQDEDAERREYLHSLFA